MTDLLLSQRSIIGLPSIKFFEPSGRFDRFMAGRYGLNQLVIYDVGAGVGHVAKRLSDNGLRVIAIDINVRQQTEFPVFVGNGVDFPFARNTVVMICRPCHGPTTEFYIKNAISRGVAEVLYVGKSSNFKSDCGRYHRRFRSVMTNVGDERESVYVMRVE